MGVNARLVMPWFFDTSFPFALPIVPNSEIQGGELRSEKSRYTWSVFGRSKPPSISSPAMFLPSFARQQVANVVTNETSGGKQSSKETM